MTSVENSASLKYSGLIELTKVRCRDQSQLYTILAVEPSLRPEEDIVCAILPFGSFGRKEDAVKEVQKLMKVSSHRRYHIVKYAVPEFVTRTVKESQIKEVMFDHEGKIIEQMESDVHKKDEESLKQHEKTVKTIEDYTNDSYNPDHVAHFERNLYTLIKCKDRLTLLQKDIESTQVIHDNCLTHLREHFSKHPEHENEWETYMKLRLECTGCNTNSTPLVTKIVESYSNQRDTILNLQTSVMCSTDN